MSNSSLRVTLVACNFSTSALCFSCSASSLSFSAASILSAFAVRVSTTLSKSDNSALQILIYGGAVLAARKRGGGEGWKVRLELQGL
jgi:hypothetical protein